MRAATCIAVIAVFAVGATFTTGCGTQPICLNCGDAGPDLLYVPPDLEGADLLPVPDGGICDKTMLETDPNHCGSCTTFCPRAHAVPSCVAGKCEFKCDVGYVDLDGNPANDCEYKCLATGPEICDGIDNDCNGVIDDGFNLMTDPANCGACGNSCTEVNAVAECKNGVCATGGCLSGYADLDGLPGCEYRCPVYPPLTFELCNGIDDNCDGNIDEASALAPPATGLCNTTPNTPCAGTTAACETKNGVTTYYCQYGAGVEFDPNVPNGIALSETKCDGIDGDCDGIVDGSFTGLNGSCDNGLKGACRDVGKIVCDKTDDTKTTCDLSFPPDATPGAPSTELCNNIDDDCDGVIDNTTGPLRLVENMVHVTSITPSFYIDTYEASRPDATSTSAGVVTTRSCSNANAQPWTQVAYATAQAACTAGGLTLCTAAQWSAACEGTANSTYPYGNTYAGATCDGADYSGTTTHAIIATGTDAMCKTPTGIYDLSGNVKEWTSDQQGTTSTTPAQNIYVTRGGAYGSPSAGLTCATTFARAAANESLPDLGFRCCKASAP